MMKSRIYESTGLETKISYTFDKNSSVYVTQGLDFDENSKYLHNILEIHIST